MRPLHVVLDQIRWDARLDVARFRVRWTDRSADIRDEPLTTFLARRDVPHHRVRSLWCDGAVVWDRSTHVDVVHTLHSTTSSPGLTACAFWNVLDDGEQATRAAAMVATITASGIPCWGLVEVTDDFCARLETVIDGHLWREGSVAAITPPGSWQPQRLPLPGRDALLVSGEGCAVAVAHLTSSVRGDRSDRRKEQRDALARALPATGPLVVMLDANSEDELPELARLGLVDVGVSAGPTWRGSVDRPPRRLDRILVRDLGLVDAMVDKSSHGSDHWPLLARPPHHRRRPVRDNPTRALCILPPPHVADVLNIHRVAHDAAFARWPAHLNVAFPFVDDDQVVIELARHLTAIQPWPLKLGETKRFGAHTLAATAAGPSAAAVMAVVDELTIVAPSERTATSLHATLATDGVGADVAGLHFTVDHLAVLARDDDGVYRVSERLYLGGGGLLLALHASGLCDFSPAALPVAIATELDRLPGSWAVVGSTARGVRFIDSDYDIAWSPPDALSDPLAKAQQLLGGQRLDTMAAPRIATTLAGHDVDIVIDQGGDARRAATSPLDDQQLIALRALRLWARQRGLRPAHNNGMPSSVAWLGLVQPTAGDAAAMVVEVWRRLVDVGDIGALSGTGFRGVTPKALGALRREATRALSLVAGVDDDRAPWRTVLTASDGPLQ
jgi:uncharacterized protein (UPF0248 family)